MKVNPEKFQAIFMKPQRSSIDLPNYFKIGDVTVNASSSVTLLGVKIDNTLNFEDHINDLCKKASRQLKVLYRFRSILVKKRKYVFIGHL